MLNILIIVISMVTLALMTSDPRASVQKTEQSAWQQPSTDIQDLTTKAELASKVKNKTEQT